MKFKVVIPQTVAEVGIKYLEDHDCEVVIGNENIEAEHLKELLKDADGALIRTAYYSADVLASAKKLKVLGRFGVGLDRVDLEYCKKNDIMVVIAPGANSNAVAEHTIMFILMLARNAVIHDENTRNGNYNARNTVASYDVIGKTLTILGFGNIGKLVAQKAHDGLGMKIVAYGHHITQAQVPEYVKVVDSFYDAVALGDFVSVNIPGSPQNTGIINKKFFATMKPNAYVINCARGSLQNEEDLLEALKNHRIAGAALDVSREEPNNIKDELWSIKNNLILTPHTAALTVETNNATALLAAKGIVSVLQGKKPEFPAPGF